MNKMKKMLACLSAAAMFCSSAVMMNVSAVEYKAKYDVNVDGSVDIADVLAMNKYRLGVFYVSDPSTMDVDGNLIINYGDSMCIMSYVMGMSYGTLYD